MKQPLLQLRANRTVATWIILGIIMLIIQVVLGGITRLTGSGLSITEWNVVTGTLPPLSRNEWLDEFEKYRQTPQYQILNTSFTLEDFQFIYFWEWLHRLWARLIGLVFVVGYIYLVSKKYLKKEMQMPLLVLFLMGALQGAIGWIMVASGLTGDAVYVKPTRLALHFVSALVLIGYAFWFALQLKVAPNEISRSRTGRNLVLVAIIALFVQFVFGALMAGHKAAMAAPTWPDINGSYFPPATAATGMIRQLVEDKIIIHFVHRNLAYLLTLFIIWLSWKLYRLPGRSSLLGKTAWIPAILVIIQSILGISAILGSRGIIPNRWGYFEWMAQLHQLVGMLLLLSLVLMLYLVRKPVLIKR